jgi:hypothetical protein
MKRRFWTDDERKYLRRNYPDRPTNELAAELGRALGHVYSQAQKLGLEKSQAYLDSPAACRLRRGDNVGAEYRFKKGQVPSNKGLRRPGWRAGRMAETQFKKGERRGVAVELYRPIGTERISKDGYLERKVNDDLPLQARWRAVHLIVWEAANGPLPAGHAIAFKNGDKSDRRLENLELITRGDLMRRNTIHNYPPEVKQTVRAVASLTRAIRKRVKIDAEKQPGRPA